MDAFRKLFGKKPPANPPPPAPAQTMPQAQLPLDLPLQSSSQEGGQPPPEPFRTAKAAAPAQPLRLADPTHPARPLILQIAAILDQHIEVELAGERVLTKITDVEAIKKALDLLDQAIADCPGDLDLLVARASLLQASLRHAEVEDILRQVLAIDPYHFEARMWLEHPETWSDASRNPAWHEGDKRVHLVMDAHLHHDHRLQLVRDGLQKAPAIVTGVQGLPFDPRTQIQVAWYLSQTPYGPLVAYYVKLIEPGVEPSTMEAFVPIFQPRLFSPLEGCYLIEQLAFTPYCYVVLVEGMQVLINRKVVFGPKTTKNIREIVDKIGATQVYLPQEQFKAAMQWHMNSFDLERVVYE